MAILRVGNKLFFKVCIILKVKKMSRFLETFFKYKLVFHVGFNRSTTTN